MSTHIYARNRTKARRLDSESLSIRVSKVRLSPFPIVSRLVDSSKKLNMKRDNPCITLTKAAARRPSRGGHRSSGFRLPTLQSCLDNVFATFSQAKTLPPTLQQTKPHLPVMSISRLPPCADCKASSVHAAKQGSRWFESVTWPSNSSQYSSAPSFLFMPLCISACASLSLYSKASVHSPSTSLFLALVKLLAPPPTYHPIGSTLYHSQLQNSFQHHHDYSLSTPAWSSYHPDGSRFTETTRKHHTFTTLNTIKGQMRRCRLLRCLPTPAHASPLQRTHTITPRHAYGHDQQHKSATHTELQRLLRARQEPCQGQTTIPVRFQRARHRLSAILSTPPSPSVRWHQQHF